MFEIRLLSLCLLTFMCATSAAQADDAVEIEGFTGQKMILAEEIVLGGGAAADATLQRFGDSYSGHGDGFRVATVKQPGNHYDIEVRIPLRQGVKKGDTVYTSFWMRTVETQRYEAGEGFTLFRIQRTAPPWERGLYREWSAGPTWTKVYLADRFEQDLPAGSVAAVFSAGYPPQTLEIAGLEVVNFGPDVDPDQLPVISLEYAGSEPDAAWREAAEQRIEQHRKGDLTIEVVDASGQPLAGVPVHVELQNHAFDFGAAISADWLSKNWDTPDGEMYRTMLAEHFNSAAIENALKWSWWERRPKVAMKTLRWLDSETDLKVHGHVLVWPGLEKFRVEDAKEIWAQAQDDPQILRDRVDNHIRSILTGTAGLVEVWDVVNEAYNQNDFIKLLGDDVVVDWFKLAREHAPDAVLLYNDFGLLGQSGKNRVKQDFVYELIKNALAKGAPIDAIGFQSHLGGGYTPPTRIYQILDRYASLGVELQITEYDLSTSDPELAERYTRDFMTMVFSHPAVTTFQGWNFWSEATGWMPEAAFFGRDWNLLPVGRAYDHMVNHAWKTDVTAVTDAHGQVKVRGFLGTYRVTAEVENGSLTRQTQLHPSGQTLQIGAYETGSNDRTQEPE